MRAIAFDAYGSPDVLRLREFPDPQPGPDEVLIRARAGGVGPGDCKTRQGRLQQHFSIAFPKITGRDGTGVAIQPAGTVVVVSALVWPGMLLEVDVTASTAK
jgi:NADPH:quinone reductase-like Zn-dependent oxidoreductase